MRYLVCVALLLVAFAGCGLEVPFLDRGGAVPPRLVTQEELAGPLEARGLGSSVELTKEAVEVRRLRLEHAGLIESIEVTPTPLPTLSLSEKQRDAGVTVLENPAGIPLEQDVGSDWFDPRVGLEFYRPQGGDWTPRRVRGEHSHRRLFYYDGYPAGIPNFHEGTIVPAIARDLAFEAVQVLPILGEVTPGLVTALTMTMGWELRPGPGARVNIWSEFQFDRGPDVHRYVVGGVLEFSVSAVVDDGVRVEYLVPGDWVGPVVVERLPSP